MQAKIRWRGDASFAAETGSGHQIVMDGPPDHGGQNQGARPMETILAGVGGCSSFDVVDILKRSRQAVSGCECDIEAERADAVPAVFTKIHMHFRVWGENLKEPLVKRAVALSAEKYCSGSIMLERGGVDISHSYEIVEGNEG